MRRAVDNPSKSPTLGTVAITGLLLMGIGVTGCAPSSPPVEAQTVEETETENQPEVSEISEESPSDEIFNQAPPERFDEYEAMSLEEFNQLPIESRVEYAAYMNRDYKQLAEAWYEETKKPLDKLPMTMTVGSENTGEEIMANTRSLYRGAITTHFLDYSAEEAPNYPALSREKMVGGLYLDPSIAAAENWRNAARNEDAISLHPGVYAMNDTYMANEAVLSRSENYTLTDSSGIERVAVDVTFQEPDHSTFTGTYILVETPAGSHWVVAKI